MAPQYSLIPESAPFNEEQRAWLNGFLAGWMGLQESGGAGAAVSAASVATALLDGPAAGEAKAAEVEEDFPWHDSSIVLDERLRLADGRPLQRRLMAAMAQLNCGSCGYDCRRYAEAIVSGEEKSLKLCSPGGKETAKALKELVALDLGGGTDAAAKGAAKSAAPAEKTWSRTNPFPARILAIHNLNGEASAKYTSHVEIDLSAGDLTYEVGDALGVYPTNCDALVQELIARLGGAADEPLTVDGRAVPLAEALRNHFCLADISDDLLALLTERATDPAEVALLRGCQEDAEPIDGWDVLELLKHCRSAAITAAELTNNLAPMRPRLYSISSSLKAHPGQVHLTVGRVSWTFRERGRKGVASTMFADRLKPGDSVRVFVHKAHGFSVPADADRPMIMIGPGTGIAPFRAFLQERKAAGATGKNWLFFGDQQAATDFLYREELHGLQQAGVLTRLDVAFSRDQAEKIYVQTRMLEQGEAFWQWLDEGGHVYVCGDAKRMAVDVDKALRQIVQTFGGLSVADADAYVARMASEKRYCRDVY